ncbi:MAG: TonB-dependent receptor [Kaistella sp.]|nr:TonB-dependent receptor [Kaistella sp.]
MKFINMVFLFLGFTFISAQQNFKIQGKVIDFHDKVPLKNASITIGDLTVNSDDSGNFSFSSVKKGTYQITASHPDCETFSESITVDRNLELTLNLEHHISQIEAVTIHGVHKSRDALIIKTLDQEEISRNSTENLGNLLSSISGVGALKTGNSIAKPIIHGLYGSRISILNNGVKMAEQEWGVEHAPNIDVTNFEHIDVIKGASALKYGSDAIGGVVLLIPETFKKTDTLRGAVNLSGISNGRGIGVDLNVVKTWENGWALKTNGGFRKLGDLQTPDCGLMNTGLNFNSFAFTVQNSSFLQGISFDYSLTNQEIGIFRGSHIGNLEDFYNVLQSDVPLYQRDFSYSIDNPKQEIQHHLAKISAFKRFENLGKVSVDYSFQYNHRKEFDLRRGELSEIPSLDLELFTNQITLSDLIERENWELETGIDFVYQYNYSTPETQARRLIPNYTKYSGGIYSVFKYRISPEINVETALRYDITKFSVKKWYDESDWTNLYAADFQEFYQKTEGNRVFTKPELDFRNLSFSAGIEYHPSERLNLKLNYAKVSRTPNIAELFADGLHHSAAVLELGNMRLKNENGNQLNLNIASKFSVLEGLEILVNPYLFLTENFINQIPTGIQNTIRGVFPVWSYEQINARMYGIDFDANLKINGNFTYNGRFSYVNGQDLTNNQPLILMMPPNLANSLEFSKKEWKNFYIKAENRTFLQQNRFPLYNSVITIFENGEEVEKTLDLSTPPPAYSLWNLQAGLNLSRNFSAGLKVTNLFDKNYRDYLNRMRFFSDEMGRNFIINVKYNF